MIESKLQQDILNGFRSQGFYAYKISDLARGQRKPCDIFACINGDFWAIEAKLTKISQTIINEDRLTMVSELQEHQEGTLKEIVSKGGRGYVAVGIYNTKNGRDKKAFLIPIKGFMLRTRQQDWKVGEIVRLASSDKFGVIELVWKPTVGWLLPEGFK